MTKTYYAYIMANITGTLYTAVTSDLLQRVYDHKQKLIPSFTSRYSINRLVYYEETQDIRNAITREKQIKGWRRAKKIELIQSINPIWTDLSEEGFQAEGDQEDGEV
jgi:putative endonuclease